MNKTHALWLLAGLISLGGPVAQAADMADSELGVLIGGGLGDKDLVGGEDDKLNPLFGLRYGRGLSDSFNFFGDVVYGAYDGDRVGVRDSDITTFRGGLEWLFSKQDKYNWFLSGGLGLMNVNTDGNVDFLRPMASLGVGQAWEVGVNDAFRWEIRADQSFGNDSLPNAGLTNYQALLGYSWGLGTPPDSDGDGVANRMDQCPNTPKGAKVDTKGCPIDTDGDGVFDGLDKCPTVPAPGTVDGCPPDTDGDGITDDKDKCPTVPAPGTVDGCPPATPEPAPDVPRKLMLDGVNFDNDSAKLRPESIEILDKAAESLKQWGETRVEVGGYTDSVADDDYNLKLSQRRADTVRTYLINKGIAGDRLTAKGYGETSPVADNDTEEGRFKNRRVELVPQQ